MRAGKLNRLLTVVKRSLGAKDAGGHRAVTWTDQDPAIFGQRTDASDGERMRAQAIGAVVTARFVVRAEDGGAITALDRLRDEDAGELFDVTGRKLLDFDFLEITGAAATDG